MDGVAVLAGPEAFRAGAGGRTHARIGLILLGTALFGAYTIVLRKALSAADITGGALIMTGVAVAWLAQRRRDARSVRSASDDERERPAGHLTGLPGDGRWEPNNKTRRHAGIVRTWQARRIDASREPAAGPAVGPSPAARISTAGCPRGSGPCWPPPAGCRPTTRAGRTR